jgi:hypothetical protein
LSPSPAGEESGFGRDLSLGSSPPGLVSELGSVLNRFWAPVRMEEANLVMIGGAGWERSGETSVGPAWTVSAIWAGS